MKRQDVGNIGIELMGDVQLGNLFNELQPKIQNTIVRNGYKKAGKIILDQALSNFKQRFADSGKLNFKQYFKNLPLKSKIGEKVGAGGAGKESKSYVLRFLEYGTNDRQYKTKNSSNHFTGKLKSSQFFSDAVEAKGAEAQAAVQQSIVDSFNKTVAKYSKM